MEALPLAFTTGWASGINAYACVLILGLLGRFAGADDVPEALTSNAVLIAAGVLFAFEFVADKIPYVDSAWDAISTVIRPTIGAILAALLAGEATTLHQAVIATTGGLVALLSHSVKSSLRLAINTSPSRRPTSPRRPPRTSPSSAWCRWPRSTRRPHSSSPASCCSSA